MFLAPDTYPLTPKKNMHEKDTKNDTFIRFCHDSHQLLCIGEGISEDVFERC